MRITTSAVLDTIATRTGGAMALALALTLHAGVASAQGTPADSSGVQAQAAGLRLPTLADDGQLFQQTRPRPPQPPRPRLPPLPPQPLGLRAYFLYDAVSLRASDSFDAVLGTSTMTGAGGGGELLHFWKNAFARVALSQMSDSGTRVAIVDGQVLDLGIPIDVTLRTVEVGGGWRFFRRRMPNVAFYTGASLLLVTLEETSDVGTSPIEDRSSSNGYALFGGVDLRFRKWRWLTAGAEVQFRGVPGALGDGGASEEFGEKDLGGAAVRVMVGVNWVKRRR